MPSRRRNISGPIVSVGVGLALAASGILGLSDKQSDHTTLAALALLAGVFLVPICIMWLLRERRYFDPRNDYWIEIGLEDFALVTPDWVERHNWADLTPFEVKATERRNKYGRIVSVTYEAITRYGEQELKIPLGDFATRLGSDQRERAEAMCIALNALRQAVLKRLTAFEVPAGLVVAPMPAPKRKPLVASNSVVQRQ
jgi:hypothetical protein